MRIAVGCEVSGRVRDALCNAGHDAWSIDLLGPETHFYAPEPLGAYWRAMWARQEWAGHHLEGDVFQFLKAAPCGKPWDMLIAFPPCTFLTISAQRWQLDHWVKRNQGARWHDGAHHRQGRADAYEFFMALWNSDIPKIALENPVGAMSSLWRKPDQIIQPWQFGHGETKATCLWLKNLPKLKPTRIVAGRKGVIHGMTPGPLRTFKRSETYPGVAQAMTQWGEAA